MMGMVFRGVVGIAVLALLLYHTAEWLHEPAGSAMFPEAADWMAEWLREPQEDVALTIGLFGADVHFVIIVLGIAVYVRMARGTWLGVNDAYAAIILCVLGAGLVAACAAWALAGLYPAVAVAAAALAALACVSLAVVPRGMRVMRLAFGG